MDWNTNIRYLKGVGEKRAKDLHKLGIDTVGALLRYYPRGYEDWSAPKPIADCRPGEKVCVKATLVTKVSEEKKRPGMVLYRFAAEDADGGRMTVTLFNTRYLAMRLHEGSTYLFLGKMGENSFWPEMTSPEIAEVGAAKICPVYSLTAGISSKIIAKFVRAALAVGLPEDPIPADILAKERLCSLAYALENIHFPHDSEALERAKKRLVYEELFVLQTALGLLKHKRRSSTGITVTDDCRAEFIAAMPFELTGAQRRAIGECMTDLQSGRVMNRLLQGDVGSGKTAVAAALCFVLAKNGYQAALMAPTELLAEQHFHSLTALFEPFGISCVLLTGSKTKKQKEQIKQQLASGQAQVAVGTHALLTGDVTFGRLGLVITDEQHRFGVAQRAQLAAKGGQPHTLVMSATPIPRTLGLMLYGDSDLSVLDEYPRGRKPIATYCVPSSYHARVYRYIQKHLDDGRQGYLVCPLVAESETVDTASAEEFFDNLSREAFAGYRLGLLHGKLPAKEKEKVMRAFQDGTVQLLICTTVIEVGIDVPNAAIMVIENAERFGLSQLHQLRGRIGRGPYDSTCILISDSRAERLKVLCSTTDGFQIADEDLKLRGVGDFLGRRQHGLPEFKIADLSNDLTLMKEVRKTVAALVEEDPRLGRSDHAALKKEVIALYRKMNDN